jgi:hypothetical protein
MLWGTGEYFHTLTMLRKCVIFAASASFLKRRICCCWARVMPQGDHPEAPSSLSALRHFNPACVPREHRICGGETSSISQGKPHREWAGMFHLIGLWTLTTCFSALHCFISVCRNCLLLSPSATLRPGHALWHVCCLICIGPCRLVSTHQKTRKQAVCQSRGLEFTENKA